MTQDRQQLRERLIGEGFAVIPDFVSTDACSRLRARAEDLVGAFDPKAHRSVFSSSRSRGTRDDYFLDSGDRVRVFLEEHAIDEAGQLKRDKSLSVNKIGHALHELDPVFREFSHAREIEELIHDLGFADPRLLQSTYIFKQPGIGGGVDFHQDATFLYTEPVTVVGLWFALEDATRENGCLWVMPGGHKHGLKSRYRRDGQGGTVFETLDPEPFPEISLIPLEVSAGSLVVLHGLVPHQSGVNQSQNSRHAYTLHLIDGTADYPADNWLRRETPPPGFSRDFD